MTHQEIIQRRAEIVHAIDVEHKTTTELASLLKLTRERISQIYYKGIGSKERGQLFSRRQQLRASEKTLKTKELLEKIKFICQNCKNPVKYKEGKYRHSLCLDCANLKRDLRKQETTFECNFCKIKYHPFKKSGKVNHFCSRAHYWAYRKNEKID